MTENLILLDDRQVRLIVRHVVQRQQRRKVELVLAKLLRLVLEKGQVVLVLTLDTTGREEITTKVQVTLVACDAVQTENGEFEFWVTRIAVELVRTRAKDLHEAVHVLEGIKSSASRALASMVETRLDHDIEEDSRARELVVCQGGFEQVACGSKSVSQDSRRRLQAGMCSPELYISCMSRKFLKRPSGSTT